MYGRTTARKWPRSVCASGSLRHERSEQGLGPGLGPGVEDVETAAPEAPVSKAHAVLFSRAGHIGGPLNTGWHVGRLIRSELAEVEGRLFFFAHAAALANASSIAAFSSGVPVQWTSL